MSLIDRVAAPLFRHILLILHVELNLFHDSSMVISVVGVSALWKGNVP